MLSTSYLRKISDDFGLWQHVIDGQISLKDGYSLDDNARGLMVSHMLGDNGLVTTYFEYIKKSFDDDTKMFIEFFDENHVPVEKPNNDISHDTQSLTRWILGYCIKNNIFKDEASALLGKTLPFDNAKHKHLRPMAYELLLSCETGELDTYSKSILQDFVDRFNPSTKWFEHRLTYANALIPFVLAKVVNKFNLNDDDLKQIVVSSFDNLDRLSRIGVIPAPHGNTEWFRFDNNLRDIYGQQPIDASYMVLAALQIYEMTGDEKYLSVASDWSGWFTGNNIFKATLVQENNCADGIDTSGISKNFGAESTIMYLWSGIEYSNLKKHK